MFCRYNKKKIKIRKKEIKNDSVWLHTLMATPCVEKERRGSRWKLTSVVHKKKNECVYDIDV